MKLDLSIPSRLTNIEENWANWLGLFSSVWASSASDEQNVVMKIAKMKGNFILKIKIIIKALEKKSIIKPQDINRNSNWNILFTFLEENCDWQVTWRRSPQPTKLLPNLYVQRPYDIVDAQPSFVFLYCQKSATLNVESLLGIKRRNIFFSSNPTILSISS